MPFSLSVGARWALRYTVAMAATLTVFAVVVYVVVAQHGERAAALVARAQAGELLAALEAQARYGSAPEYEAWCAEQIARRVAQADPELGLGIRLLRFDGRVRHDAGSLKGVQFALPEDVARGRAPLEVSTARLATSERFFIASTTAPAGFLQVAVSTRNWEEGLAVLRNVMLAALPLMLLVCGAAGFLLARRSLAAVDEIRRIAEHVSSANLHETIPTSGSGDELDRLAATLNAMIARIRDGVAQMHRFNANAAHELRTPLHRLGAQIDAVLSRPRDAEAYHATLLELREEADALGGAVNALLRLAQMEAGLDPAHTQPVELSQLLRTQLEFFAPLAEQRGVVLAIVPPLPEAVVRGDASWLERLFSNLLDNAVKHCTAGDRVEVLARTEASRVFVTISDTGPGIAPADLPQLFERFARGASQGGGSGFGLGLPLAREIARAHDGTIEVASELGRGARFTVALPLFTSARPHAQRDATRSHRHTSRGLRGRRA